MNEQAVKVPARDGRYIKIHDAAGFEGMRKAGQLAAECLDFITPYVKPGVSTDDGGGAGKSSSAELTRCAGQRSS